MAELKCRRDGAVATVVFSNLAKFNAVTPDMWAELPQRLAEFDHDPAVRVIVLEGDGDKAFVSGHDLSAGFGKAGADGASLETTAPYNAPLACAKPTIAKIRGICMGGGLGLAAACDLRITADDAQFRMPAARLGLGYGFESVRRVMALIGPQNTADIFFTARRFDAADALRMGFVLRVVPAAELDAAVATVADAIAGNAPLTLLAAKRSIQEGLKDPAERDVAAVQVLIDACRSSADLQEGQRAFREKRAPVFEGR
jgi:enoyl-CoA hydratase/carnithine racemase